MINTLSYNVTVFQKFKFLVQRSKPGIEFSVHVSYIEIYKEELRDLIDNTMTVPGRSSSGRMKRDTQVHGKTEVGMACFVP